MSGGGLEESEIEEGPGGREYRMGSGGGDARCRQ